MELVWCSYTSIRIWFQDVEWLKLGVAAYVCVEDGCAANGGAGRMVP